MRATFTTLVLTCFVLRQFTCCQEQCAPCANADDADVVQSKCPVHVHGHDHEDEDESTAPVESSHHICVATHLFYVTHENTIPALPDFSVWQAVSLRTDGNLGQDLAPSGDGLDFHTLQPPRDALRIRAVLNVWVV